MSSEFLKIKDVSSMFNRWRSKDMPLIDGENFFSATHLNCDNEILGTMSANLITDPQEWEATWQGLGRHTPFKMVGDLNILFTIVSYRNNCLSVTFQNVTKRNNDISLDVVMSHSEDIEGHSDVFAYGALIVPPSIKGYNVNFKRCYL